jgi:hypothetical protein
MAGIGDSWGTREELLHPRGPDGRWIKKAGIPKGLISRILEALASFRPRMFQSQGQANQYARNVGMRKPARFQGGRGYGRLLSDLGPTNEDLRDGVIDNPSTAKFVKMMDESATELPDDVILTRYVGVDAFGFTPQTAQGTSSDTDPGIRGMSGKLIADRGYSTTVIGEPRGAPPQGSVRMVIAARKGTKAIVPAAGPNDSTVFLDRDQSLRVTKIEPDGSGGWVMYAMTEEDSRAVPEPIGGPIGAGTRDSRQREAAIREAGRITATREARPDDTAEAADEAERRRKFEEGQQDIVPSPMQEAEKRRVDQLQQQAGVQPRTEPIQARSIGGEPRPEAGTGGAPASQAPGAPEAETVPRRTVDLRLAVRDAGIEAPAAGPNRKRFNDAYEGVISGKKEPIDAVRELRRDARDLRSQEGGEEDAQILDRLADVIKQQYALPEQGKVKKFVEPKEAPPARTEAGLPKVAPAQVREMAEREEESRAARAAKRAEAREAVPAKAAKGGAVKKASPEAAPEPTLAPVAKKAPAKMAAPAELTPEQQIKGLFNGKRPTNAQLRQMGEDNDLGFGPKEPRSEMILAILGARPSRGRQRGELTPEEVESREAVRKAVKKAGPSLQESDAEQLRRDHEALVRSAAPEITGRRVPGQTPAKKAAKRVSTEDRVATHLLDRMNPEVRDQIMADMPEADRRAVEEAVQRVREAGPPGKKAAKKATPKRRDDLDNMSKEELTEVADREGVQVSGSPSEATLRKRIRDSREAQTPGDDLDSMTKQQLLDEAEKRGVSVTKSWTKDRLKARLRGEGGPPSPRMPRPRGATAPTGDEVRQKLISLPEDERFPYLEDTLQPLNLTQSRALARGLGVRSAGRSEKPEIVQVIVRHFEGAGDVEAIRRLEGPEAPAPAKKATKAAVPEAAPGTAAGKITAGRLQPGMRILVDANGGHTTRKTGSKVATIERIDRIGQSGRTRSQTRIQIHATDEDGKSFIVGRGSAVMRDDRVGFSPSQTFMAAPEPGAAPAKKAAKKAAPDSVDRARARQTEIDRAKGYGQLGSELDELIANEVSDRTLRTRVTARMKQAGLPEEEQAAIRQTFDVPRGRFEAQSFLREILQRNGVEITHEAGAVVPLDRSNMLDITGGGVPGDVSTVRVVRPGYRITLADGEVIQQPSMVEAATPKEIAGVQRGARGASRVPDGSVKGDRTQAPIDNAPRKREFGEAWDAADLEAEGAAGRSLKEIRDDIASGKITPEEGVRRIEGEIAFNQEDLNEVDANLRQTDLTPEQRTRLQSDAAKLQGAIDAHKKASKFMRLYFEKEKPTVPEMKISLDEEGLQALERATPDDLREAAKMQGLDPPKGDTKDEILQDMVRQVAGKVARERGIIPKKAPAKKAAKAAKKVAPQIPADREKLDVRTIGAGIEFDESDKWVRDRLTEAQQKLDEGKVTPGQIGRDLDFQVDGLRSHAAIRYGRWTDDIQAGEGPPDEDELKYRAERDATLERLRGHADSIQALAERLKKTRRPSKRTAAKKAAPEVQAAETRADNAEARLINERLERLNAAKSREQGAEALDGLTMPELRRIGEQMGGLKGRSKQELRDKILDRVKPEVRTPEAQAELEGRQKGALDRLRRQGGTPETRLTPRQIMDRWEAEHDSPMSREEAATLVAHLNKRELLEIAEEFKIPGRRSKTIPDLRREVVEAGVGIRLDSIATRGFTGPRPDQPGRDVSTATWIGPRAKAAGIERPGLPFSGVNDAEGEANRMLQRGDSNTEVARMLRERAAQVAKADIAEEGRRFRVEQDRDTLRAARKANAEYLRRLATMLQQEEKSQRPAKKAPAKKAAPRPDQDLGRQVQLLARGTTREERAGTENVTPLPTARATKVTQAPAGPKMSDKPIIENTWGDFGQGEIGFHRDGIIGMGLQTMGNDQRLEVDGDALANVIGRLATRAARGQISQEQMIDALRRLGQRLPADSTARRRVERMVTQLDAPPRAPLTLPEGTPAPLRELMEDLSKIPLARGNSRRPGDSRDFNEMDALRDIVAEAAKNPSANQRTRAMRLIQLLRQRLLNQRHESMEGKLEIDRAIQKAMQALEAVMRGTPVSTP